MSKSILEKLYNGEIYPSEKINVRTEEYKELNHKICAEQEHFRSILSLEEWSRFEELESIQLQRSSLYGLENFTYGFRLGAKMILNIMEDKDPNYEGI